MTATRDLIAAALTAADELDELHKEGRNPATFTPSALREACARAMVETDMAGVDEALRLAVERTRDDLGPDGTNYPAVRKLLAFAEHAIADGYARAMCAPDMAEVERLLEAYDREYASGGSVEDYDRARTALLDYVRGVMVDFSPKEER